MTLNGEGFAGAVAVLSDLYQVDVAALRRWQTGAS